MINPYEITNYNRSKEELEEFLLFTIVVAGKTAYIQSKKLEQFLSDCKNTYNCHNSSPFEILKLLQEENVLLYCIIKSKLGQYNKIHNAFKYIAKSDIDLKICTLEELEKIPGVGPKTSRFFLLHSRVCDVAILDTHILKWFKNIGYNNAPKTTPSSRTTYKKWEDIFLDYCHDNGLSPASLDLSIWKSFAKVDKKNEKSI